MPPFEKIKAEAVVTAADLCVGCGALLAEADWKILSLLHSITNETEVSVSKPQLILLYTEMAHGEIDYNIVFPDAVTSGEQLFVVMRVHAAASSEITATFSHPGVRNRLVSAVNPACHASPAPRGPGLCRPAV